MSDMGFSYNGFPDQGDDPQTQQSADQTPKWFREKMEADSKALKAMQEQITALSAENRQVKVARELEARGYSGGAAALYQGDPDKVEEWLTANAAFLAKKEGMSAAQQNAANGAPNSAVSTDSQAAQQRMNEAGTNGDGTVLTGDDALAAAIAATKTPEEFQALAKANGWNYDMLA